MSAATVKGRATGTRRTGSELDTRARVVGDEPAAVSARRPYRAPVPRLWFLRTREYRAYALREASSVVVGLFVFDLAVGLVCLHRGPDAWQWWVTVQTRPVNLVLSVLAVVMSLVHATTWFRATPKIIRIRRGRHYVADRWVVVQHYVLLLAFAAIVYVWLGGL